MYEPIVDCVMLLGGELYVRIMRCVVTWHDSQQLVKVRRNNGKSDVAIARTERGQGSKSAADRVGK